MIDSRLADKFKSVLAFVKRRYILQRARAVYVKPFQRRQLLDSIQCINTRLNQVKQLKVFQMNQICEISALWRIVPNAYFPQGGKLFKANDIAARLLNKQSAQTLQAT